MDQRGSHSHPPLIPFTQPVPLTGTVLAGASFLVRCSMTPALACCCEGAWACPRLQVVVHLPISSVNLFLCVFVTGEVIKHGDLKCVRNEGMPIYKSPLEKGILIIQFLVSACVCVLFSHGT